MPESNQLKPPLQVESWIFTLQVRWLQNGHVWSGESKETLKELAEFSNVMQKSTSIQNTSGSIISNSNSNNLSTLPIPMSPTDELQACSNKSQKERDSLLSQSETSRRNTCNIYLNDGLALSTSTSLSTEKPTVPLSFKRNANAALQKTEVPIQ